MQNINKKNQQKRSRAFWGVCPLGLSMLPGSRRCGPCRQCPPVPSLFFAFLFLHIILGFSVRICGSSRPGEKKLFPAKKWHCLSHKGGKETGSVKFCGFCASFLPLAALQLFINCLLKSTHKRPRITGAECISSRTAALQNRARLPCAPFAKPQQTCTVVGQAFA